MYQALFPTVIHIISLYTIIMPILQMKKPKQREVTSPRSHACLVAGLGPRTGSRAHVQSHSVIFLFSGLRGPEFKMTLPRTH